MGWPLGGYYTPAWVDRLLFPKNWPSLDHLEPALLRDFTVGDINWVGLKNFMERGWR